jgi:hypothetical protein
MGTRQGSLTQQVENTEKSSPIDPVFRARDTGLFETAQRPIDTDPFGKEEADLKIRKDSVNLTGALLKDSFTPENISLYKKAVAEGGPATPLKYDADGQPPMLEITSNLRAELDKKLPLTRGDYTEVYETRNSTEFTLTPEGIHKINNFINKSL